LVKNTYLCKSVEDLTISFLGSFYAPFQSKAFLRMIFYATKRQTITSSLHAFQVLMFIIALMFCMPLTITSKSITAQQAFKIAQKYLQLPAKQLTRSASNHNHSTFITTPKIKALSSFLETQKWAKS